jgi:hypothetical protein
MLSQEEKLARHRAHTDENVDLDDLYGGLDPLNPVARRSVIHGESLGPTSSLAAEAGETTTQAEPPGSYVVDYHTYATADVTEYLDGGFAQACQPQEEFVPGMRVGVRATVHDADSGETLTDEDLDEVRVTVAGPADLEPVEMAWDGDDDHPEQQWSARLRDTEGADPGTYEFTIEVTNHDEGVERVALASEKFVFLDPSTTRQAAESETSASHS